MSSNHLILCRPLLLLPSIFPSIRVFSNESALRIRWPKYWSFSFSISPSNDYSGLISFRWYLYKGLERNSLNEKLSCKHLSLQFEELTAGGVLSSPGDQLFHSCLLRASPWHAVLWAQGPVDASRGSTWQSGGSHGSGGADMGAQSCLCREKEAETRWWCLRSRWQAAGAAGSIWVVRDTSSCLNTAAQSLSSAESWPGLDVWLHHWLPLWPWLCYLIPLNFNFFIWHVGIITGCILWGCCGD